MLFDHPISLDTALAHQHAKTVLPTSLSSAEIDAHLAPEVRRASFFSAKNTLANVLSSTHRDIQSLVNGDAVVDAESGELRPARPGERMNPALVRTRMQNLIRETGYQPDPDKRGGLQDLSSDKRVDLVIDTQTKMAQGYARHQAAMDPEILEDFPADELYRQRRSAVERDWDVIWNTARANLGEATTASLATSKSGPFVALKGDPVWTAISRFGNPYPPFDYNSGMWVRDADDALAERLGVLRRRPSAPKAPAPFFDAREAVAEAKPAAGMPPELAAALGDLLRSIVEIL